MQILITGILIHVLGFTPIFVLLLPGMDKPLVSYAD
jgi:hypothetical protein